MLDQPANSSSGFGACYASATGKRKQGIEIALDWIKRYPGIDGFSVAWLEAGGEFDPTTGQLTGATHALDLEQFARVLKLASRVQEALDRKLIVKVARCVNRPVQSAGFALPNVTVTRSLPEPKHVPTAAFVPTLQAKVSPAASETVAAPMPKSLRQLLE